MAFALAGVSIPDFWLALLLIILFSVNLGWLPAMGIGGIQYYILPAMADHGRDCCSGPSDPGQVLGCYQGRLYYDSPAKGVPEMRVITRHALKKCFYTYHYCCWYAFWEDAGRRYGH